MVAYIFKKEVKQKKKIQDFTIKQLGGHVTLHDSYPLTIVKECAEELGFPAIVLPEEDFKKALGLIDLDIIGMFREVEEIRGFQSVRKTKVGDFIQPYISAFFIGYYEGSIRFRDGEASGIETFSLEELEQDLKNNPEKYTEDLKFMIDRYAEYLVPLKKI